jgi:hypothetical protein
VAWRRQTIRRRGDPAKPNQPELVSDEDMSLSMRDKDEMSKVEPDRIPAWLQKPEE